MLRFISTTNPGEQVHGENPHMPHLIEIPPLHALHHPQMAPHVVPLPPPPPPHARVGMPLFELEESDFEIVKDAYQNEDTAAAATETVYESPREIQLNIMQVLNIINQVLVILNQEHACLPKDNIDSSDDNTTGGGSMTRNLSRWANPVLDGNAKLLFMRAYGEKGKFFTEILRGAPYEIGVCSTLLAYLKNLIDYLGKQNNEEK